ncbi:hypothetical protein [Aeromonas veronii]|uniref:hypothetical protein n=1 Tax=Aeromonas veronii TaxID=654 RepID=UPI0024441227|nr:hypothetical protein [Aeromonas veronii]
MPDQRADGGQREEQRDLEGIELGEHLMQPKEGEGDKPQHHQKGPAQGKPDSGNGKAEHRQQQGMGKPPPEQGQHQTDGACPDDWR